MPTFTQSQNKPPTAETARENTLFQDFMALLKLLEERPLGLTATGNLQRKEILVLSKIFKFDLFCRDKFGDSLYPPRSENNFKHLIQIRQIIHVMDFTYKRSRKLHLNKRGKDFLSEVPRRIQYELMVLCYLAQCNWAYIHHIDGKNGRSVAETLQDNQLEIWEFLIDNNDNWFSFEELATEVLQRYGLWYDKKNIHFEILNSVLIGEVKRVIVDDLSLFDLIESKKEKDEDGYDVVKSIRATPTGIYLFKQLQPNQTLSVPPHQP